MSDARPLTPLDKAQPPFYVGVDLGGTNIKVGLVDDVGQTLHYLTVPTEVKKGPDDASRRMGQAVKDVVRRAGLQPADIAGVGLGSPGTMDIAAGTLLHPVNLHGWNNFPLAHRVREEAGYALTFANDANAAAYGEFWVGSGRDLHSMVMITLGTGIGSGIVIGDLLIEGEHSHGAECGHMIIDYHGSARLCSCGNTGHIEAYCSAWAVVARTQEGLQAGRNSSIGGRLAAGEELTPLLIAQEATAGDAFALEIVLDTAQYLGIGLVNVMHTFDPNGVVLGGAMNFGGRGSELGQRFLGRIRQEIQRRAFPVPAARISIDYASLGGDAGYIGAAGLARRDYKKNQPK